MKKMTLFREYNKIGMDLSWLYDVDNILDVKKKQAQEDWLDNHTLDEIATIIDDKITDIKKMIEAFEKVKNIDHPIVLHIKTLKGKGLTKAR